MIRITALFTVIVLLQGCSGAKVKEKLPNITSTPVAATIFANGVEIGITPLHKNLYEVFPAAWSGWTYQASGVLSVKKAGCSDFNLKVSDAILAKPIHAKLNCDKHYVAPVQMPVDMPVKSSEKMNKKKMSKTEKRLGELKGLYGKGVITEDEYKATRKRILNEL